MTDIRKCAFCGQNETCTAYDKNYSLYEIVCVQCIACCYGKTKDDAIKNWNTRTSDLDNRYNKTIDDYIQNKGYQKGVSQYKDKYEKLLSLVKCFAMLDSYLEDTDDMWKKAKTVQDGIDYADQSIAKLARELLKEIGELE